MKFRHFIALLFITALVCRADETNGLPAKIKVGDEIYEDVVWGTVTPSTVSIRHKTGVAAIPLEKLPSELQMRFGYDPKRAAEYRAADVAQREKLAREAVNARRRQEEGAREFERKMSMLSLEERTAKARREAELAEIRAKQPVNIYVKDVKNFPRDYEGKPVRVRCDISRFQRVEYGEFKENYQLDVKGVAPYRSTYTDKLVLDEDGSYLSGFFIVAQNKESIITYCHENMDEKHIYYANISAVIRKSPDGKFFGDVFRVAFVDGSGKIYKIVESEGEVPLAKERIYIWIASDPPGGKVYINEEELGNAPAGAWWNFPYERAIADIRVVPAMQEFPRLGFIGGKREENGVLTNDVSLQDVVFKVTPNSNAERVGMRPGDRLVAVNGVPLPGIKKGGRSATEWEQTYREALNKSGFGGNLVVTIIRDRVKMELTGKTAPRPEGVFYVQERKIRPARMDGEFVVFDMRVPTDKPVRLGQPSP